MGTIPLWGIRVNEINKLKYVRFYGASHMPMKDFEALKEVDELLVRVKGNVEEARLVIMVTDTLSDVYGMPDIRWPVISQRDITEMNKNMPGKRAYPLCGAIRRGKSACIRTAGAGTQHFGMGHCSAHGGNGRRETIKAAWLMAHAFAREMDITPWEALLKVVRVAAGKLEYAQYKISTATHDLELEGRVVRGDDGLLVDPDSGEPLGVGGLHDLTFWVKQAEMWHERLLRASKAAIDSGIAERLMAGQTLQVQLISRVVEAGLGTLRLTPGDEASARAAMRAELLRIDSEKQAAIEGELLESIAIGPAREQL